MRMIGVKACGKPVSVKPGVLERASEGLGKWPPIFVRWPTPRQWWELSPLERASWCHPVALLALLRQWTGEEWAEFIRPYRQHWDGAWRPHIPRRNGGGSGT